LQRQRANYGFFTGAIQSGGRCRGAPIKRPRPALWRFRATARVVPTGRQALESLFGIYCTEASQGITGISKGRDFDNPRLKLFLFITLPVIFQETRVPFAQPLDLPYDLFLHF
jgi:hypothetical protein